MRFDTQNPVLRCVTLVFPCLHWAIGCGPSAQHQGVAPGRPAVSDPAGVGTAGPATGADGSVATAAVPGTGVDQETSGAANVMPDTPPDPSRSLPEVTVENVGLHIGGQSNDPASKEPFQRAVAARFEDFLGCYRYAQEPAEGGTYGVDLYIRREGGHPDVRQPRTGMKGEQFRQCVRNVFESVQFGRPRFGPTVISYSIRFNVRDPSRSD